MFSMFQVSFITSKNVCIAINAYVERFEQNCQLVCKKNELIIPCVGKVHITQNIYESGATIQHLLK